MNAMVMVMVMVRVRVRCVGEGEVMALMAVAWLVPIIAALLAVSRLLKGTGSSAPLWRWVLHLSLAVGVGLGACSLFLFVWLMVFGPPGVAYLVTESALGLLLIAALLALTWRERRTSTSSRIPEAESASQRRRPPLSRAQKLIVICFGIVVLVSAVSLAYWVLLMPHGGWDAWAIWNLRARFIYRAGESWPQAFGAFMPHTDYPLLIPLSVVRGWAYLGSELQIAPAAIAALFAVATAGLMVASVAERRGATLGLLAGMVLLTTPLYLEQGAMQTADVPLAFFFLATTVLLAFYERTGRLQPLFLAGVTAGLASWAKNEGLLLVVAVVAAWAALALTGGRDRPAWENGSGIAGRHCAGAADRAMVQSGVGAAKRLDRQPIRPDAG